MNAAVVAVFGVVFYLVAYYFYARYLGRKVFRVQEVGETPAHTLTDGVDYVPARASVLYGHHFASIAGLGPIAGPAIAVIWGWLPATLWILLGCVFLGAVHDFGSLTVSLKHQGRSIGDLTGSILGRRGRVLFLIVIFFLLALAMGVFALIVGQLFAKAYPQAVIPVFGLMIVAVGMGWAVYKLKVGVPVATVVGLGLMFLLIWTGLGHPVCLYKAFLGTDVRREISQAKESGALTDDSRPGTVEKYFEDAGLAGRAGVVKNAADNATTTWIFILLGYALVASILPVWLLLQPRDYLNSYQLYIGLGGLFLGVLILHPKIAAPAVNHAGDLPSMIPLLFITIACGAISGFHSLVSSGTTARQLDKAKSARLIAYGGMLTEGLLALLVVLACTAGVGTDWAGTYSSWGKVTGSLGSKLQPFFTGSGTFLHVFGIPPAYGAALMAVVVVGFAMTTLDTGTRLLRYNIEEFADTVNLKKYFKRYLSSLIAVTALAAVALWKVPAAGPGGATVYKPAGIILWRIFGTTNQLMAALALLVITVYLIKKRRPSVYTAVPFAFMLVVTSWSMVTNILKGWNADHPELRSWSVVIVGSVLIIVALWLAVESLVTVAKARRAPAPDQAPQ
ncbi:MAG: carbon starvation protein A [Planctomycetes bacterium]|nr:carbon starvation protein A [Planctomycetota bacterium]